MGNIFDLVPSEKKEVFEEVFSSEGIRFERIISSGQTSPEEGWYDQPENEWVILLQGTAKIKFDNNEIKKLKKGDYLFIAKHCKHKVVYTSAMPKCIWLAVFFK